MANSGTPSFEMESRRAAPPYRETLQHQAFDFGELLQQDERALMEYHKAQSNAAFEKNRSIPGFTAAAVASRIPPLPIYETHDPRSYQYAPEPFGRDGRFHQAGSQTPHSDPSNRSPFPLPSNVLPSRKPNTPSLRASAAQVIEEGELSEGEFEESQTEVHAVGGPVYRTVSYSNSKRDAKLDSTYHVPHETVTENEIIKIPPLTDIYGRALDPNRHQSESYSPYEPPQQIDYLPQPSRTGQFYRNHPAYQEQYGLPYEFGHMSNNDRQLEDRRNKRPNSPETIFTEQKDAHLIAESSLLKSLFDARKEAQNAILNLWPLKVRFQDYVDEGIDEEIVRRQFESLGMPAASTLTMPGKSQEVRSKHDFSKAMQSPSPPRESLLGTMNESSHPFSNVSRNQGSDNTSSLKPPVSLATLTKTTNLTSESDENAGEERKDRIARLVAEKYKKHQSSLIQSNSPKSSASPEAAVSGKSAQSAAKADKERLLRQKMEALQKSREQRAQKAAAKSTTSSVVEQTINAPAALAPSTTPDTIQPLAAKRTSPPQITSIKPAMPTIPGLFLATTPRASQHSSSEHPPLSAIETFNHRKRPVASDFDGVPAGASSKRPFGQSRNDQPLVIDVSDEDSENDEIQGMDIDDGHGNIFINLAQNGRDTPLAKSIRDLPPLSDFPPRKQFPIPSSTVSTPPSLQAASKSSLSKPEDLLRKEMEIQEMKRKIAEAERRKKAKQNLSGSQTPQSNNSGSSPAKMGMTSSATDKLQVSSVQIERLIIDASHQVDQDQRKLAEAHAVEQEKADELKQSEVEQKRLRRAKIASDLPLVDAEVEKGQRKLAELQAEIARIEASVQQGLDEKRRLAEELEKLSQEADEQLLAQKNRLRELRLESSHESALDAVKDDLLSDKVEAAPLDKKRTSPVVSLDEIAVISHEPPSIGDETVLASLDDSVADLGTTYVSPEPADRDQEERDDVVKIEALGQEEKGTIEKNMTPDQAIMEALKEASAGTEAESSTKIDIDVEMADSYVLDSRRLTPSSIESPTVAAQQGGNSDQSTDESSDNTEGESDIYEPPEATPPATNAFVSVDSPPFSPAPPETISAAHTDFQLENTSLGSNDTRITQSPDHSEVAPPPAPQTDENDAKPENRKSFFTPYESPLKNFRAYRFHPEFEHQVQGGFKSITYSNNIKNDKEFCRYELAGDACNDPACEFQHFKDIGLADDAILVELGNSAGYSEEDKPRFVAGLRTVLQGLRAKRTKDFKVIASEIAAYRASFLGDKSKVLLLDSPPT